MKRGFKEVTEKHRKHGQKVNIHGTDIVVHPRTFLPVRATARSAGYDFATPIDFKIPPHSTYILWTNVKAYMQEGEVLKLFVRSSIGIKEGIRLANGTGIVDADYFENPDNDGNIGIALHNHTGQTKLFKAGDRIAQGIFMNYLIADDDDASGERTGGTGSTGK